MMQNVTIADTTVVGGDGPLLVIAGPCVMESAMLCHDMAGELRDICRALGLPFVFKASFDKANRSSIHSFRGPGLEKGLDILREVRRDAGVPVVTDIHQPEQAGAAAQVVDMLQIPAFLCRQSNLITAAADTGLPVLVKKGQFMAPQDMKSVIEKAASRGNNRFILCERGTCLGYNDLVVDMRSIPLMQSLGRPVVFDMTHSTQKPGALGDSSGGDKQLAPALGRAAVAAGADGVFLETHPDPDNALCDAATMLPLRDVSGLLARLKALRELVLG